MSDSYIPISLPSKGLLYDGIDVNNIKIRTFKGKEEALIAELNYANLGKKFCTILEKVLTGISPKQLTSGDAKYVLLWEAINSYGRTYKQKLICEDCLEKINVSFDLGDIDSVEFPDDITSPVDVTLSSGVVQVKHPTLEDEVLSHDLGKKLSSPSLHMYALCLCTSEKLKNPIEKVLFLEELGVDDLNEVKKAVNSFEHGPDMIVSYTCPECGYEGKIELPFRTSELFSFRKQLDNEQTEKI